MTTVDMTAAMTARNAVTFGRETFTAALLSELYPLFLAHWRELGQFPYPDIPPGFEGALYAQAEAVGALRVYTARAVAIEDVPGIGDYVMGAASEREKIVGYAVFFLRHHPHHVTSLQAVEDMLYIAPSHRGLTGPRLIRFAESQLAADGVQVVLQGVPATNDWSAMLERMGYALTERVYAKRLDRPTPENV